MSDIAIKFENISKQYRLGVVGTGTVSHDLNRWWHLIRGKEDPYLKIGDVNDRSSKAGSDYVWALRDINFEVKQGDVVGIIGKNGAGKSTLLKILSRVTSPTTGCIKAKGRIASLLEVGTGFHPELTGRENIYMNGAIMGMTKAEITSKLDEIVDFAGVEKYIDTPTKRYSSGMTVRLGFAIAAHLEPEILVVDEVLAVGDAEFQKKAIGKMQDVSKGEGRTVLFVSHNMGAVETLCTNGVLIENGTIHYIGSAKNTIETYLARNTNRNKNRPILDGIKYCHPLLKIDSICINEERINDITLISNTLNIKIKGTSTLIKKLSLGIHLLDKKGTKLCTFSNQFFENDVILTNNQIIIDRDILLPKNITNGEYFLNLFLYEHNIAFYFQIEEFITITFKGFNSKTGIDLNYNEHGFLILE